MYSIRTIAALSFVCMSLITYSAPKETKPTQKPQSGLLDPQAKEIVGQFAGIVGNFGNIVGNPKDSANIGLNISQMFARLVQIFTIATRNKLSEQELRNLLEAYSPEIRTLILEHVHTTRARLMLDV